MPDTLYFDHNASTPVRPEVAEAMHQALRDLGANPWSAHREGQRVRVNYQTYLGRTPSPDEVTLWVNGFLSGLSNESMVAGFVGSPEYYDGVQKGQGSQPTWVMRAYLDVLFRAPSPDEVAGWLQFLG